MGSLKLKCAWGDDAVSLQDLLLAIIIEIGHVQGMGCPGDVRGLQ
jgi:hypothetical protein